MGRRTASRTESSTPTTSSPSRARVTAVTLSAEQGGYVRERCRGLGLGDRAEVRIQDYRDVAGDAPYDAIASVEMGEHVGAAQYPRFCAALYRLVRPGTWRPVQAYRRAADQTIDTFSSMGFNLRRLDLCSIYRNKK